MSQPPLLQSASSFVIVGAIATGIHYTILIVLVEILSVDPVTASILGFVPSAAVNYALNYRYSFRSTKAHQATFPKFAFVAGIALILNAGLMAVLVDELALNYLLAQIATTGLVLVWNFTANRLWSFAPDRSGAAN